VLGGEVGRSAKLNLPCSVRQHAIHMWETEKSFALRNKQAHLLCWTSKHQKWNGSRGCNGMTHGKGMENVDPARRRGRSVVV